MSTHHPVKAGPESKPGPTAGKPPASPRPKKPAKPTGPGALKGSPEARRQAALILEVLCGVRTATDASKAMGIALPRYYLLETRALQGFILALEPLPRGPQKDPASEIAALKRLLSRQKQELARNQSLLRASQRAMGLPAPRPENRRPARKTHPRAARSASPNVPACVRCGR
ncbi:MAG: hypothetical protein M5U25_16195 [Planctomycetota bacterium]|nr:hypothetical protein [Planctomycetota bacterium]